MTPAFSRCLNAIYSGNVHELKRILALDKLVSHEAEEHGRTLLMTAICAEQRSPEILRVLLDAGADPNQSDNEGWNAVHFAAREDAQILDLLLAAGGDPHIPDPYGNNPISIATFSGRKDISRVKLLLAVGANPTVKNKYGNSALDTAKKMGCVELVALLEGRVKQ